MPKYLIEVSQPRAVAAKRIENAVRTLGTHFATHADWRQQDAMSIGSIIVEAANRLSALGIVPPGMRASAVVSRLELAATLGHNEPIPSYATAA